MTDQEMDWEEYEKILMQKPGFKKALDDNRSEYENARNKIKGALEDNRLLKKKDLSSQH